MDKNLLAKIKLVFISHYHSDHHYGVLTLCKKRVELGIRQPVIIVLSNTLYHFYKYFSG